MLLESTDLSIVILDSLLRTSYCTSRARRMLHTFLHVRDSSTDMDSSNSTNSGSALPLSGFLGLRLEDICAPFCHLLPVCVMSNIRYMIRRDSMKRIA